MKTTTIFFLLALVFCIQASYYHHGARVVNCNHRSLLSAFNHLREGQTLKLIGTCEIDEPLIVDVGGVTITSNDPSNPASIVAASGSTFNLLTLTSGFTLTVSDISFSGGNIGIKVIDSSSLHLTNVGVSGAQIGAYILASSTARFENVVVQFCATAGILIEEGSSGIVADNVLVSNTFGGFGFQVQGSSLTVEENGYLESSENLFGLHLILSSSAIFQRGSSVNTSNNVLLGASINSGSSLVVFNADYESNNNVLDGVSVSLNGVMFVDQDATVLVNDNGRDGLRIEQGVVRLGNLPGNPVPSVHSNGNGRFGTWIARQSTFDSNPAGPVGGLNAAGNGAHVDVFVDFNSGFISKSTNAGVVFFNFNSYGDFNGGNTVGSLFCVDSQIRGDDFTMADCPPPSH